MWFASVDYDQLCLLLSFVDFFPGCIFDILLDEDFRDILGICYPLLYEYARSNCCKGWHCACCDSKDRSRLCLHFQSPYKHNKSFLRLYSSQLLPFDVLLRLQQFVPFGVHWLFLRTSWDLRHDLFRCFHHRFPRCFPRCFHHGVKSAGAVQPPKSTDFDKR